MRCFAQKSKFSPHTLVSGQALSMQDRKRFYEDVKGAAEYLDVHNWTPVCRDPKDDKFLALAVAGMADFLITGDQDLLALHPFQKVAIVTPLDFLALQTA